jgi:hypothetical protein
MRPGCDLDVFGHLTVAGDPAVMRPIQPDDLGQQTHPQHRTSPPDGECRSRYRATCNGLIANTA